MLPREARMRRPEDFRLVMRKGKRSGSRLLAIHVLTPAGTPEGGPPGGLGGEEPSHGGDGGARSSPMSRGGLGGIAPPEGELPPPGKCRVGFVVSKAVGSAVVRNRVKRRLRELIRARLADFPEGCLIVVRAHPAAAGACQADLAADLDLVLERLWKRQFGALRQA